MKRVGTITFNGQPASKHLKRHIGFVMQVRPLLLLGTSVRFR